MTGVMRAMTGLKRAVTGVTGAVTMASAPMARGSAASAWPASSPDYAPFTLACDEAGTPVPWGRVPWGRVPSSGLWRIGSTAWRRRHAVFRTTEQASDTLRLPQRLSALTRSEERRVGKECLE